VRLLDGKGYCQGTVSQALHSTPYGTHNSTPCYTHDSTLRSTDDSANDSNPWQYASPQYSPSTLTVPLAPDSTSAPCSPGAAAACEAVSVWFSEVCAPPRRGGPRRRCARPRLLRCRRVAAGAVAIATQPPLQLQRCNANAMRYAAPPRCSVAVCTRLLGSRVLTRRALHRALASTHGARCTRRVGRVRTRECVREYRPSAEAPGLAGSVRL
jgi:hypothetical protein